MTTGNISLTHDSMPEVRNVCCPHNHEQIHFMAKLRYIKHHLQLAGIESRQCVCCWYYGPTHSAMVISEHEWQYLAIAISANSTASMAYERMIVTLYTMAQMFMPETLCARSSPQITVGRVIL